MSQTQSGGAIFFDEHRRTLGWATRVTRRTPAASLLACFDVAGAEADLASRLALLDHRRLRIECLDEQGTAYQFRWASGYSNGVEVRIQGELEWRQPPTGAAAQGDTTAK
jgi:hypothetical protein